jgi:hypothetical protein
MNAERPDTILSSTEALRSQLLKKPFDFEAEWPIRMGVITRDELIYYMQIVVSHHSIDDWATPILEETLRHPAIPSPASQGWQPFDEAQYQSSPAGRRIAAAAEAYWRGTLQRAPFKMFHHTSADPRTPRYWSAELTSPALPLAIQYVSREMKVSTSAVLLAALSMVVSRATGGECCVLLVQAHNRFRTELRRAVSSVTMPGLFLVETEGASFREMVKRAWVAALTTYQFAYYDKRQIDAVKADVERRRGGQIDLSCWLNDRRPAVPPRIPDALSVADIKRRLSLTRLEWPRTYDSHDDVTFGLRAYDIPGAIKLELIADTHVLAPAQMEQFLRDLESIVAQEAIAGLENTG